MQKIVYSVLILSIMIWATPLKAQATMNSLEFQSTDSNETIVEQEPNNSFDLADDLTSNKQFSGQLNVSNGDRDYIKITIPKKGVDFALAGAFNGNGMDISQWIKITLYDAEKQYLKTSEDVEMIEGVSLEEMNLSQLQVGDYYLCISADSKSTVKEINYHVAFDTALPTERIMGEDRFDTAVEISKFGWESAHYAVIATGRNFPDALAATPLAKKNDAPLLLVDKNKIPDNVMKQLNSLGVSKVHIIGGTSVISTNIEDQLEKADIKFERIYGDNRYETALEIAKTMGPSNKIAVATGQNFADALSIAPIAAKQGMPILLTEPNKIPEEVNDYLDTNNITKSYVIGGPLAISDQVFADIPEPHRIYGMNRYETNYNVISTFKDQLDFTSVYAATGANFPDALTGSALAALNSNPLLISASTPDESTEMVINTHYNDISKLFILGGENALSDRTVQLLN
ncbi:cell wall-binding repeat-containing protein [Bacillus carboniphilus]|uniref:Cell wall-binding repeat-containing protein n=1 Tax=Bacillus carboniphilus TaxID=86663 RepID=A0ABY9JW35_9BACI|nr:cell wall-binding repeat-containing protein [Bacillus carboniphilus]WLR43004.1 cell wall-binding repeat-containing protein [Bacillus carboniphilus]